ncbi:MAG: ORF6N domain-containing protein [Lachnospiraceae bacterium]|nr:ORF6N domain-containing protein [Lachnospiraceae bacterium]
MGESMNNAKDQKESKVEIALFEPIDKETVKNQIYEIRGIRVMIDRDISEYFGVETKVLNRAMKRNIKRFPESFCFQLTAEECARYQTGTLYTGRGANIKYMPHVYSEQGVAMLTSTLHTDRAIAASIQIMEAFVEMSHYIRQNQKLLPQRELQLLEARQENLEGKVREIKESMVTKSDLSELMLLFDQGVKNEEILILDGEPFKADVAYQKIYRRAKKNIIVVDDYLGVKTLQNLTHAKAGVKITVISDNMAGRQRLRLSELNDFLTEYPGITLQFVQSGNAVHDRYIVLDYGTKDMKVYHCGASSKDAGNKITTISRVMDISAYKNTMKLLMNKPQLVLR